MILHLYASLRGVSGVSVSFQSLLDGVRWLTFALPVIGMIVLFLLVSR